VSKFSTLTINRNWRSKPQFHSLAKHVALHVAILLTLCVHSLSYDFRYPVPTMQSRPCSFT